MDSTQPHRRKCHRGDAQRFLDEALRYDSNECLLWPYTVVGKGYPSMSWKGKIIGAHRQLCILEYGPPPADGRRWEAAHSCGNRICMNRKHLRWALPVENAVDKIAHRTDNKGEKHGLAKLGEKDVRTIRELKGSASQAELARRFNVSGQAIRRIYSGETWGWLT